MFRRALIELIRYCLLALGALVAFPFAMLSTFEKYLIDSMSFFHFGAHTVALIPGVPGNYVRTAYYIMTLKACHPTVVVSFGTYFSNREASIAAKAGIGAYCVIGQAQIGERVRIASRVSIVSGLHEHGNTATYGDQTAGLSRQVRIGDSAWLGEGAIIAADVGESAVVSMGAVVFKPVPPHSMAMGNPARSLPLTRPDQVDSKSQENQSAGSSSCQTEKASRSTESGNL